MDIKDFLLYDELPFWSAPFGIVLIDTARIFRGMKALDLGSGGGFPMLELAERIGLPGKVYGIDPSPASQEMIRKKIALKQIPNAEIVAGTAEELPFEPDFFDLVVANNGINNVNDQEKALRECLRVLKPGGQAVMTANLPFTMIEFYDILEDVMMNNGLESFIPRMKEHIGARRKPAEYLRDLILHCGFGIRSIALEGFKYRFATAEALFRHTFLRTAFLPPWEEIVPADRREDIFSLIRARIDASVRDRGIFELSVPFACFDFYKPE